MEGWKGWKAGGDGGVVDEGDGGNKGVLVVRQYTLIKNHSQQAEDSIFHYS